MTFRSNNNRCFDNSEATQSVLRKTTRPGSGATLPPNDERGEEVRACPATRTSTVARLGFGCLPSASRGLGGEKEEKEGKERKRKKRERRRFKAEIPCACNVDIPDDIIMSSGHADWPEASSVGKSTRTRFPSGSKTPLL